MTTYDQARQEMAAAPPTPNELLMFTAGIAPRKADDLRFMLALGIYDPARVAIIEAAIKQKAASARREHRR